MSTSSARLNGARLNGAQLNSARLKPLLSAQLSAEPVSALRYADIAVPGHPEENPGVKDEDLLGPTLQDHDAMVAAARTQGGAERESQIRQEYQQRFEDDAAKIAAAVDAFRHDQQNYFLRVEAEVVKLSLAIAARILHREAQVDPMLLAALVRVAINQMHDGSRVTVRIRSGQAARWREYFSNPRNGTTVEVVEDSHLGAKDCVLETDLGSANFSIDGQLKEVEQGFFDLLALRPAQ